MCKRTLLIGLGLLLGGCARSSGPSAPQAQMKRELPVICRLVSRNQTLTISAGPNGAVYSVSDAAGKVMLSHAGREELRQQYPFLSQQLDSGIASVDFVGLAGRD